MSRPYKTDLEIWDGLISHDEPSPTPMRYLWIVSKRKTWRGLRGYELELRWRRARWILPWHDRIHAPFLWDRSDKRDLREDKRNRSSSKNGQPPCLSLSPVKARYDSILYNITVLSSLTERQQVLKHGSFVRQVQRHHLENTNSCSFRIDPYFKRFRSIFHTV